MKTLRAAALLLMAMFAPTSSVSALPITLNSYSVSANTSGNDGLEVNVAAIVPFGGDVTTPDLAAGGIHTFSLFRLSSDENSVSGDDDEPQPITVTFNFSSPSGAGNVGGQTVGGEVHINRPGPDIDYEFGRVTWGGPLVVTFSGGQFQISLANTDFWCESNDCSAAYPGGEFNGANIQATITLTSLTSQLPVQTAVPEPTSVLLLGTGLVFAARRLRKQKRASL